jgi:hypothetical protein
LNLITFIKPTMDISSELPRILPKASLALKTIPNLLDGGPDGGPPAGSMLELFELL